MSMMNSDLRGAGLDYAQKKGASKGASTPTSNKFSDAKANISRNFQNMSIKQHFTENVVPIGDEDREIYQMVTNVPKISKIGAIASALLNFLIPGFGTAFAACSVAND